MRWLLVLSIVAAFGCGTRDKMLAPEGEPGSLPDVTYAVPKTEAKNITKIPYSPPNACTYVAGIGWTCPGDMIDENGVHQLSDDGAYICAPKFVMYKAGDPTSDD